MSADRRRWASSSAAIVIFVAVTGCGAERGAAGNANNCPCHANASVSAAPNATTVGRPRIDEIADELLRRINAKDGGAVVAMFGESMRKAFPVEKTGPFVAKLIDMEGPIDSLAREPGGDDHHAVYVLKGERGQVRMEVQTDVDDKITSFEVTAASSSTPESSPAAEPVPKSTIDLALPYRGQWSVLWGGDTPAVNAHIGNRIQMRAADLGVVGTEGKTFRGDGKANSDYYAYGREIVAVADGVVAMVVDGVPENDPGAMNPYFAPGNVVIVRHTDHVFSLYAHLQPGKVRVKRGAAIKKGTVLGLCGNSGNASEPHLHFQLQDSVDQVKGLPIEPVFKNVQVVRDGRTARVAEYTFLKGDLVGDVDKNSGPKPR